MILCLMRQDFARNAEQVSNRNSMCVIFVLLRHECAYTDERKKNYLVILANYVKNKLNGSYMKFCISRKKVFLE